jgi:signal peptidase I
MGRGLIGLLAAVALAFPAFAAGNTRTFTVPSESMAPAFSAGDRVVVDLDAYDAASPAIGDAIVFHPPKGAVRGRCGARQRRGEPCRAPTPRLSSQLFLKRVVATPGDRLSIRDGRPVVNGSVVLADLVQRCRYDVCDMRRAITIPADHYFVLGDNSAESADSRFWGPVPSRAILGKVIAGEASASAAAKCQDEPQHLASSAAI